MCPNSHERRQHERRPQEPGGNTPFRCADQRRQRRGDAAALVVGRNAQLQRDGAAGLGLEGVTGPAVPRRGGDLAAERAIRLRCRSVAQDGRGVGHEPGAIGEERVGEVVRVRLRLPWAGDRGVGVEPIAELRPGHEEPVRPAASGERIHPCAHARELPLEHGQVPVRLVDRPRHDRGRVGPARPSEAQLAGEHHVGHDRRHAEVRVLVELEVAQPARPERGRVEQRAAGRRERLRVAGPAESLVALRTVGRDGDEVVALRPHHVLVEPGQVRIRAFE